MIECDGERIRNMARDFPEIFPALEREDRAPELIQPHRHDRRAGLLGDYFKAAPEPQKRATTGKLAFRENANDLTLLDALDGGPGLRRGHAARR